MLLCIILYVTNKANLFRPSAPSYEASDNEYDCLKKTPMLLYIIERIKFTSTNLSARRIPINSLSQKTDVSIGQTLAYMFALKNYLLF